MLLWILAFLAVIASPLLGIYILIESRREIARLEALLPDHIKE